MSIINNTDKSAGRIELVNGWVIQLGTNEDTGVPQTIIGIIKPNGDRYNDSRVLRNTESPADIIDEFEKSAKRLPGLDQLDQLEKHESEVICEMIRILPEFDTQGNRG